MIRRAFVPSAPPAGELALERKKDWVNILFLFLTPVIGVLGTAAYVIAFGVRWWEPALFLTLFGLVTFSVRASYLRCCVTGAQPFTLDSFSYRNDGRASGDASSTSHSGAACRGYPYEEVL